jgi:hypothetical protein
MSVFEKNGVIIIIKQKPEESDFSFYERGWFIINQKIETNDDLNKIEKMSNIWKNTKNLKCKYSQEIMDKLYVMENNM